MNVPTPSPNVTMLFHYCRIQFSGIRLQIETFQKHLERTFALFQRKQAEPVEWSRYLEQVYALDTYLCFACLERQESAWQTLFGLRTGQSDCLLIDALRARAVRLYPRDEERQESAVNEFWSHLLVAENANTTPILTRYDGQRPLAPWLIRVFQNWHISYLRSSSGIQSLPDEDLASAMPTRSEEEVRWHQCFCQAANEWIQTLSDNDLLLLGMRWRYRLSQREVAQVFQLHEGTISRQTDKLRDKALEAIGARLTAEGWNGNDLQRFILTEMGAVLMDQPRLSADQLTLLIKKRGLKTLQESQPE